MTGQDFLDRLNAIKADLQSVEGRGNTVNVMLRNAQNQPAIFPLSSDANGVLDNAQEIALTNAVSSLADFVDEYNIEIAPYTAKAAELKAIAESPAYQTARAGYKTENISENYAELANALGSYVV